MSAASHKSGWVSFQLFTACAAEPDIGFGGFNCGLTAARKCLQNLMGKTQVPRISSCRGRIAAMILQSGWLKT